MTARIDRTIEAARQSFNEELLSADYPRIHDDDEQVSRLIAFLDPRPGGTYLDLATGNGAVAFAIAGHQPQAQVIGVDIADRAVARNRASALEQAYGNIEFLRTDGRRIAHPAASFDGIACRYALHHFPDLDAILADARRVLKPAGVFVVADAVRHPSDDRDFINRFQALKPDGHVKIYTADNLVRLLRAQGFDVVEQFASAIAFTRDLNSAYRCLIEETPRRVLDLYDLSVADGKATLSFGVLNVKLVVSAD
jgi:ubiquinone/menaquinone biosynthesis C-methylase UbiE